MCQLPDDAGRPRPDGAEATSDAGIITISLSHRKISYDFEFGEDATVLELFTEIAATLDIPLENQKIIVPKSPLLSWPPRDPHMPLEPMQGKKLLLMGSGAETSQAVQLMSETGARRTAARAQQRAKRKAQPAPRPRGGFGASSSSSTTTPDIAYTFLQIQPLRGLPHPERSRALLTRLANDPGIVAAMRKHKFTVALLTEMEPLANTQSSHEGTSRLLGLNRNQGEAIELRLRTDAHDGYRDYKTIRKTLCHELAHNVHSNHDRDFWDLCHQIEREVAAADWKSGGHTIGETSRYHIMGQDDGRGEEEEDEDEDDGGWTGGAYVLGGVREHPEGMSRREILARAAIERQKKDEEAEQMAENGWRPCQRPRRNENEE